jgi:hypothetical protein
VIRYANIIITLCGEEVGAGGGEHSLLIIKNSNLKFISCWILTPRHWVVREPIIKGRSVISKKNKILNQTAVKTSKLATALVLNVFRRQTE